MFTGRSVRFDSGLLGKDFLIVFEHRNEGTKKGNMKISRKKYVCLESKQNKSKSRHQAGMRAMVGKALGCENTLCYMLGSDKEASSVADRGDADEMQVYSSCLSGS